MNESGIAELRARLVRELRARGDLRSPRVIAAFERVPRHLFLPQYAPQDVYVDRSIAIKLDGDVALSSSSQPAIMATMLEMLALREGDHVLEIGTGSGYNAALLADVVGPSGEVTTIDIDRELAATARQRLDAAGYARVRILARDGAEGDPDNAPFDAIVATAGVDRVPPAWSAQLHFGGRLVAPVTIRARQKVIAFERMDDGLEACASVDAAFIMLRGPWASGEGRYQ